MNQLWHHNPLLMAAVLMSMGAVFALASAWFFQLVIGLAPCPLCLEQRQGYYAALVIAPLTAFFAAKAPGSWNPRIGILALLALMLWTTGLAIYHAGAEWQFWPGPSTCTGAGNLPTVGQGFDLMKGLQAKVVSCTEVQWRLFGLSMAGWNALIAGTLSLILALALVSRGHTRPSG